MTYDELLAMLAPLGSSFPTLGGRRVLNATNGGGSLVVTNSGGVPLVVSRELYEELWKRFQSLPEIERYRGAKYTDPSFVPRSQPGVRTHAPLVPAIWKACGL